MITQQSLIELRRRLNPEKQKNGVIHGCYISAQGTVISEFEQPLFSMPKEELEKYMSIFKRVLSGVSGQNLLEILFSTSQVVSGEAHSLLMKMNDSALQDDLSNELFYKRILLSLGFEEQAASQSVEQQQNANNWLVLLFHDVYDIPYRDINGAIDHERDQTQYSYLLCAVCQVKQTKPSLSYQQTDSVFHIRPSDWNVSQPDIGFLFPSFEDGGANISAASFYTKDTADTHQSFMEHVFEVDSQMPACEQKETFQAVLETSLKDECSLDVLQTVHETVRDMIEEQKKDKNADPVLLTGEAVKQILLDSGVSSERSETFKERFNEAFGEFAEFPAVNMIQDKPFSLSTPSVSIKVDPDKSDLIETRIIDGKPYILILADGGVAVNGVNVNIRP